MVSKGVLNMKKLRAIALPRPNPLNKRQRRAVKRLITNRMEIKHFPIYAASTSLAAAPSYIQLTAIAQGDTDITRDGIEINLRAIVMRIAMYPGTSTNGTVGRAILFQWKPDSNVDAPAATSILETSQTLDVYAPYSVATSQKYKILWDSIFALNLGAPPIVRKIRVTNMIKKLKYTSANSGTNQLYILTVNDAAVNFGTYAYGGHVEYTDS